jgi:hypothetical protein
MDEQIDEIDSELIQIRTVKLTSSGRESHKTMLWKRSEIAAKIH